MPGESGGGGQLCSIRSIWRVACSTIAVSRSAACRFYQASLSARGVLLSVGLAALLQALGELLFFPRLARWVQQEAVNMVAAGH